MLIFFFFFFKQKTAYEMRISDWSSDVCSSDLPLPRCPRLQMVRRRTHPLLDVAARAARRRFGGDAALAQFMGEALAPMMKVRLARIEPRSVGTLGRDRQVDMRMSGVGVERHNIAELPFEFDARERLDGIMDGCGIGRTAGHRQHHRHRGRSVLPMRVHRLIEHVPVGSNSLQALFLSDDLALTASDFELPVRSEEHTSELQSLMRISYAVFCFQK